MAKRQKPRMTAVTAAQIAGRALGRVAGRLDSLKAKRPHPVVEARKALAVGQKTLAALAPKAGTQSASAVKKTKAVAKKTRKTATRTAT